MNLGRSLYKSVRKRAAFILEAYGGNLQWSAKSIFGHTIDPQYWESIGRTPLDLIQHYFRKDLPSGLTPRTRSLIGFELLKRMNKAVSDDTENEPFLHVLKLRRGKTHFSGTELPGRNNASPSTTNDTRGPLLGRADVLPNDLLSVEGRIYMGSGCSNPSSVVYNHDYLHRKSRSYGIDKTGVFSQGKQ